MRSFLHLDQSGDTIVEVMIVLAILGLSFGISYATANTGLLQSRNAEEHSEALGMLESQVELTRAAFANNQDLTAYNVNNNVNDSFCLQAPTAASPNTIVTTPFLDGSAGYLVPQDSATDDFSMYPSECVSSYYYTSVTYRTPSPGQTWQPYFDFLVRWQGIGNLGLQQEELTYKISDLTSGGTGEAYFGNQVPLTCPTGDTGAYPDCIPPATAAFSWVANGADLTSCTDGEPAFGDGLDGCLTNSPAAYMFGWRDFNAVYSLAHTESGTVENLSSSAITANLTIYYRQYAGNGLQISPSPNNCYNVNIYLGGSLEGNSCLSGALPGISESATIPITVPADTEPTQLGLDWTNNYTPPGYDNNFEVDQIGLNYDSASTLTAQPQAGLQSCNSAWCGATSSGGEYSCDNGTFTYSTANLTAGTTYHVTLLYSNQDGCSNGYPAPPGYSYTGTLSIGSLSNQAFSLPAGGINSPAYSFTATSSDPTLTINWNNDTLKPPYDANLQIDGIIISQ